MPVLGKAFSLEACKVQSCMQAVLRRFAQIFNETVINPPAELGRLTDAGGGEQSIKIENSAV